MTCGRGGHSFPLQVGHGPETLSLGRREPQKKKGQEKIQMPQKPKKYPSLVVKTALRPCAAVSSLCVLQLVSRRKGSQTLLLVHKTLFIPFPGGWYCPTHANNMALAP